MNIEKELTLLMTASIDPKGMPAARTRPDPHQRQQDYAGTLTYYLQSHPRIRRIVFAENSGWPLDDLKRVVDLHAGGQDVEFLSFSLNDFPRQRGKSYGEMLLLDHAFDQSRLVRDSAYIAKLTGRNYLANLTSMLEHAPVPFSYYGDLRDHPFYEWAGLKWNGRYGESRFFIVTPDFYRNHLCGQYVNLDDSQGRSIERFLHAMVKQRLRQPDVIGRFRNEPDFRGLAGHWGKDYGSTRERAKRGVRSVVRRVLPFLWI